MKRSFSYIFVTIPLRFGGKTTKIRRSHTDFNDIGKIRQNLGISGSELDHLAPDPCAELMREWEPRSWPKFHLLWIASLLQSRERVDSPHIWENQLTRLRHHRIPPALPHQSRSPGIVSPWFRGLHMRAHEIVPWPIIVGWKPAEVAGRHMKWETGAFSTLLGDVFTFASGLRWWTAAERYSWPCWSTQPELRFNMLMSLEHLTPEVVKIMKTKISCRQDYYQCVATWHHMTGH